MRLKGARPTARGKEPMPGIDSLLRIMIQQDAAELRLVPDQPPCLVRHGQDISLTMPPMPASTLQELLGDLWTRHEAELHAADRVSARYSCADLGDFDVLLRSRAGGEAFEAIFTRAATPRLLEAEGTAGAATGLSTGLPPGSLSEQLRRLVSAAAAAGASDVHLTEKAAPVLRIDGALRAANVQAIDPGVFLSTDAARELVRKGGSIDLGIDVGGVGRVRVHVYATSDGLAAAMRILPSEPPRLADLALPVSLHWVLDLPHGLVIVCGPTGSGKSSTLAALAREALEGRPCHLITLEDPIEHRLRPGPAGGLVRQRQAGVHFSSFSSGLRDALRADPDILLIGEMRDPETISLALTAAETGHLVLTSLHSRTAVSAIERIVDAYPPERQRQIRVQLADSLRAVVSQRLLPRSGGKGRIAALEVLRVSHAVANLIREGKTAQIVSALQSSGEEGMLMLERSLADLVRARAITLEAAQETAGDLSSLRQYLARP